MIKSGWKNDPKKYHYKEVCRKCSCVFKFKEEDIEWNEFFEEKIARLICPYCGQKIIMFAIFTDPMDFRIKNK